MYVSMCIFIFKMLACKLVNNACHGIKVVPGVGYCGYCGYCVCAHIFFYSSFRMYLRSILCILVIVVCAHAARDEVRRSMTIQDMKNGKFLSTM